MNGKREGYLHQFDWRQQAQWQQFRGELTLGVHGTSNMFKHSDFHRDAIVATGAVGHAFGGGDTRFGLAGDYRFGAFTLYPQLRTAIPLGRASVQLNLPVAIVLESADRNWQLGLERHGEKWGTLDSDREITDKLYLQEWRLDGRYRLALRAMTWRWLSAPASACRPGSTIWTWTPGPAVSAWKTACMSL